MVKRWWIIESPTRGVLYTETTFEGKPRFRWSTPRGADGDMLFDTRENAERHLAKLPEPVRRKCYVFGPIPMSKTLAAK